MKKYINIILFSFFGLLSINLNLGLSIYIPYISYIVYVNKKNILLVLPLTILSILFFDLEIYILLLIYYIPLLIFMYILNINKKIYIVVLSIITNLITYFVYLKLFNDIGNVYLKIISLIICPLLCFLLFLFSLKTNDNQSINFNIYNELLIAIIVILSSIKYTIFNVSLSFLMSLFYCIYFSYSNFSIYSLFFSFIVSIISKIYLYIEYSYIMILLSVFCQIKKISPLVGIIILYTYLMIFHNDLLPKFIYIYTTLLIVFFEVLKNYNNKFSEKRIIMNSTDTLTTQLDLELESFSVFLDTIARDVSVSDNTDEIAKAIEKITGSICINCNKRIECYQKNKGKLYYFFKNSIIGNEDNLICEHGEEIRRMGRSLGYKMRNKNQYITDLLVPMLTGISNIIKQYKVNHSESVNFDIHDIYNLKEKLLLYGYSISLFNVDKIQKDNFLIEIGIIGVNYENEKNKIKNIANSCLQTEVSLSLKLIKGNKIYITVIPKIYYEVTFGYGAVSKIGNNICGDNYLIKNIANKKFIAAICDGMGKGLNANIISSKTLRLLEQIINENMNSETSLQILNTLYYIQDYQDNYTTIDYIEINKNNGEMYIYKAGAAITYIIHENNEIEKIENESLPFGLNELIISKKIKIRNNDIILLASDGIFDNVVDYDDFERFIINNIKLEPQKMAYEILNYARHSELIAKDDMSIIALKVKEI